MVPDRSSASNRRRCQATLDERGKATETTRNVKTRASILFVLGGSMTVKPSLMSCVDHMTSNSPRGSIAFPKPAHHVTPTSRRASISPPMKLKQGRCRRLCTFDEVGVVDPPTCCTKREAGGGGWWGTRHRHPAPAPVHVELYAPFVTGCSGDIVGIWAVQPRKRFDWQAGRGRRLKLL